MAREESRLFAKMFRLLKGTAEHLAVPDWSIGQLNELSE